MRILFFTRQLSIGGCQVNAINLAVALERLGHHVVFAAEGGPLVESLERAGIAWEPMEYMSRKHPSRDTVRTLARLVDVHALDLIQAFDPIPILEAYGSQWLHDRPVYGLIAAQPTPEFRLARAREVALVNPDTRDRYVEESGWAPERIRLITARLDCRRYRPIVAPRLEGWESDETVPTATLVSRIDEGKWPTIELWLSAAAHWATTRSEHALRFAIVGGGPELGRLRERLARLAGTSVVTTGERLDIPEIMNASAVVLGMASTCQQGMACGRPVVVLGEQGYSELVSPESFEFLASQHFNVHGPSAQEQPEALCAQLQGLLDDRARAARLGEFGRARALERYDSSIGARQLEAVYAELLQKPPSTARRVELWTDYTFSMMSLYAYRTRRWLGRSAT